MKTHLCCRIASSIIALAPCLAQNAVSPEERFDKLVQAEISAGDSVGTAVAVVFRGRVVHAKASGMARRAMLEIPFMMSCSL